MSHIMKYTEWESATGWHTGDLSDLAHNSNSWWYVPRMLNMELTDYILMLKNDYNVVNFHYSPEHNVLLYKWQSYNDCHKFTLFVNKEARKRKFLI